LELHAASQTPIFCTRYFVTSPKPELDKQTGRSFIALKEYDAFQVGRLVPAELVDLVTVRQQGVDSRALIGSAVGIYAHGNLQVVLDYGHSLDSRQISISGEDLAEVQEAYDLFRQGKLSWISWEH
jgi:hypothetical protein